VATTDTKTGFTLYTFAEIVDRVRGDFDAEGLNHSRLARSLLYPFVFVLAGVAYLLQGRIAWGVRQSFVTLASLVNVRRWGRTTGKPYIVAAQATTTWTFTGLNGTSIPAGTEFADAGGNLWTTDGIDAIPVGLSVAVPCTSTEATSDANVTTGDEGTLTTPIVGLASTVTAAADATDGQDDETQANHVERILESWAEPEQWSGSQADYKTATRTALANVDKVGAIHPSDNIVSIIFTMDPGYGDGGGVLPTAGNVNTVQGYIDEVDADGDFVRKPITAAVTAYAATETSTALTIAIDGGVLTGQADDIEDAVDDMLRRAQQPGLVYTVPHELWVTAIQNALGSEAGFTLTAPAGDVTSTAGQVVTRDDGATTIT
jgi:uncharacterized phage protein gp47/JayE